MLKPVAFDNAKPRDKAYALTDGGGLLLEVLPSGTKTWCYKYHLPGKRGKVTIGAYPAYSAYPIKQARDRHEESRALVERGESPAKSKPVTVAARKVSCPLFPSSKGRWLSSRLEGREVKKIPCPTR